MSKPLTDSAQFRSGRVIREIRTQRLYTVTSRGGGHVKMRRHFDGTDFDLNVGWCVGRFESTRMRDACFHDLPAQRA